MTSKRHTRSTSATRQDSAETEFISPFPGYGPRASVPSQGFLPDPDVLTRRPRRRSEEATLFAGESNLPPHGESGLSGEYIAQSDIGVLTLDSMIDLLGHGSIAAVGLEEYFDVFIFWTADASLPHEDRPSRLVPDSSKTSESIIVPINIDKGSGSAQDRRVNTSSGHTLTPLHTQTHIPPTPLSASL